MKKKFIMNSKYVKKTHTSSAGDNNNTCTDWATSAACMLLWYGTSIW